MTQELLHLLPQWGPWLLAISAFLSSMMMPLPSSFLLLTAGALSGTGHLHLPVLLVSAAIGASLGDLAAFFLARKFGPWLNRTGTKRAALMMRARKFLDKRGTMAVFLSRWLMTPLGPSMNYVAGAAGQPLHSFAAASVTGEFLWATIHLLFGHFFGRSFRQDESAVVKAIVVGLVLATLLYLLRRWIIRRHDRRADD